MILVIILNFLLKECLKNLQVMASVVISIASDIYNLKGKVSLSDEATSFIKFS